ncbi:energy transducer TonB [Dyella sp. EPa41]|uniref:energy transducer TonB n=1 Tax=Dyella sp. EPa41 TaxID=1561194 RepID=UPI001F31FFA8|nr:energy transducer TonB [Dyella sp. EPa41]
MPYIGLRLRHLCLAAATVVLACCASASPRHAGAGSASALAVRHIPLALGQTSTGATPREQPLPGYPPALRMLHLPPQDVEVRLAVDARGKVSEVHVPNEAQADPPHRLFIDAVREAAMRWTFVPWRTRQWAADANGEAHSVGDHAQPFEVGYVFRFAMNGDVPVVDVHAATP